MIKVNEQGFIYDTDGLWYPPINRKQLEIFNDYHRFLLVHGPRMSGKTWGIIHKVIRHAFDVNGAMVAIICKTLKNAKSAGVWFLLCKALAHWESQCLGFKIVEGPKTTGDTKLSFVRIKNRHGTVSEIQCHSLEHAQEVEAKFKGSGYSMFWLSELDQYCTEHAWDILCDALRMTPFVPFEQHQIIGDCNPPDSGPNNWMHDKWFKFKDTKPAEGEDPRTQTSRDRHERIQVMIDDNPQLEEEAKHDLIERYKRRKAWYNRFILGLWEQDLTGGHFSDVWDETIHVAGVAEGDPESFEILAPHSFCKVLLTGWDVGESKNHSFHIIDKITDETAEKKKIVSFSVIDELVVIKTHISVKQFCEAALEKMDMWETWVKENLGIVIRWRHWSDTSAFQYRASANTSDSAIVYESTMGRVQLDAAPKYRDSNRDKVKLLWQLLYERRLLVSAQLRYTRLMFTNLREGGAAEYVKENEHKHPFDSLSYPILAEAPIDMIKTAELLMAKPQEPKMVSIRI